MSFVSAFALLAMSSARSQAATLAQLFPDLARLPDTTALEITVAWSGYSPDSPVSGEYRLELHDDAFEGTGRFKVSWASSLRKFTIPRDNVQALLAAARDVELVEKDYKPYRTHTDDYPYVGIKIHAGQELLVIETKSQRRRPESGDYIDRTPWGITYRGRTFVVTATDLDKALEPLLLQLQYAKVIDELAKQLQPHWGPD